jgi:hypothetical protein
MTLPIATLIAALAFAGIAHGAGDAPPADAPAAAPRGDPLRTRDFVQMRRASAQLAMRQGRALLATAESGACGERAQARAPAFRRGLDTAESIAAKAQALVDTQPPRAAQQFQLSENNIRGWLDGFEAIGCLPPE